MLETRAERTFAVFGLYTKQGRLLVMKEIHKNISDQTLQDKNWHREQIDVLRSRLPLLEGKDRVMMTMYLENGNSARQLSRLLGVSETCIARRIRKLKKRLTDGAYITCLRNREKFSRLQMAIAKDYFLDGLSIMAIVTKRHCSRYRVRRTIAEIRNLIKIGDNKKIYGNV